MNSLSRMIKNIFSDNSNIMLAAIISLLLVILFVLLLHLYAKWFLFQAQARARRRRRRHRITTVTVSDVFGPARFHHFHSFNIQDSPLSSSYTKGLDSSIIAAIPMFMYKAEQAQEQSHDGYDDKKIERELECVICLSRFEDGEMGKCLPKCGHGFHVECIDMWLSSHSNCPICRAPIVALVGEGDDSSALVEIVVDDAIAATSSDEIRENENGNDDAGERNGGGVIMVKDSQSSIICGQWF
ncbi:PREDICTED: RING-H2 finger protein ATL63-like isoform X2 [Lupinus angustifolius]|uniref:RING-H2 finger protein ATL63-like isoform X2 n=1 Tax=Lupinus angustifolius TaxID=3871 RepID=UPI00092E27CB|nr:PREDICTED: RING-H2 finger protein ATL63-like isoform X2 [Lupinus angustifolius]